MKWQFIKKVHKTDCSIKYTAWFSAAVFMFIILHSSATTSLAVSGNEPCYEETLRLMELAVEQENIEKNISLIQNVLATTRNEAYPTRTVIMTSQGPVIMGMDEYKLLLMSTLPKQVDSSYFLYASSFAVLMGTVMRQQNERAQEYVRESRLRLNAIKATIAQLKPGVLECIEREYGEDAGSTTVEIGSSTQNSGHWDTCSMLGVYGRGASRGGRAVFEHFETKDNGIRHRNLVVLQYNDGERAEWEAKLKNKYPGATVIKEWAVGTKGAHRSAMGFACAECPQEGYRCRNYR